jgi:hypothetical protein
MVAVDHDPVGSIVPLEYLAQKQFGGGKIAPHAEPEFDSVAIAVDGLIEIFPLPSDVNVGFVNVPLGGDGSLSLIEPLQQLGGVRMIKRCTVAWSAEIPRSAIISSRVGRLRLQAKYHRGTSVVAAYLSDEGSAPMP